MFCAIAAQAEMFYWKGGASAFADYGNPVNWDVGSSGGGNAGNLLPGAEDAIFGLRPAMWNLGGETRSVGVWNSDRNESGALDWARYAFSLTNGTLSVMQRISHTDDVIICADARLVFPEGSTYAPSRNCGGAEVVSVLGNGALEIRGEFSPYRLTLTTARYGYSLIDPTSFRIDESSAQPNVIRIEGTNEIPHGLVWTDGGSSACSLTIRQVWSGRMIAAGDFSRNGKSGVFNFQLAGGYLETCGDLSFSGVDSCTVEAASTFVSNDGHTLDISNFSFYNEGTTSYKLGPGTLAIGDSLPPTLQVNAGTIAVRTRRSDLAGVKFAGSGITVRFDVPGCRLDGLDDDTQLSRVAFKSGIDMSSLSHGVTLFSSANGTILAAMKANFEAALPEGFAVRTSGDSLVLADLSQIEFDASVSSNLSDAEAWGGEVPVGGQVTISGNGTVVYDASAPAFKKITVTGGATLSIQGGTAESPVTPPPLAMSYDGKIACAPGSFVRLTNELACTAQPVALPVFEIATNAVLFVDTPDHSTKGFTFTNLRLNYFGTIHCPDAATHSTPCLTFGTAAADATAYFGLNVDGGTLVVTNTTAFWQGNCSLIRIMCPEEGGAVHPVGELTWRNFTRGPDSVRISGSDILANSGYDIGVNNPENIPFTLNVSGTPIGLNGTTTISGGANIVCTGADSGLVKGDTFINYSLTQYVTVKGAAKITLKDGARFSNAFVVGNYGAVYFTPTSSSHISLEVDGGAMEFYRLLGSGSRTAKVLVRNGCYDVGRLMPESTLAPEGGWKGAAYSPVFDRFRQIEVTGLLQVRATDAFPRPAWWHFDGQWDRRIDQADMPFSGTGSLLVTNTTEANSMTFTLVNRGNGMTGTIAAAPGTRSTLLFKDDCKWGGTVIANGCTGFVNTDATTGKEKPARVVFNNMRLEGDFPVRLWRTDGVATNDFIKFEGAIHANGGAFVGEPMEDIKPSPGDTWIIGTYPVKCAFPRIESMKWQLLSEPIAGNAENVHLLLKYQPPGFMLSIR